MRTPRIEVNKLVDSAHTVPILPDSVDSAADDDDDAATAATNTALDANTDTDVNADAAMAQWKLSNAHIEELKSLCDGECEVSRCAMVSVKSAAVRW